MLGLDATQIMSLGPGSPAQHTDSHCWAAEDALAHGPWRLVAIRRQQKLAAAEASVQAVSAGAHIHLWLWCAASYCIDSAQESHLSVGFLPSLAADAWLTPAMLSIQLLNGPLDVSDPEYPYPSSYMLSPEREASILKSWPLTTK